MYDLISYTGLILRYLFNVILGYSFLSKLSTPKCGRIKGSLIFGAMYLPFQIDCYFAFNRIEWLDDALCIVLDIGMLLIIQRLMFNGSFGKALFAAMSFVAGKNLLSLFIAVTDYRLLGDFCTKLLIDMISASTETQLNMASIFFTILQAAVAVAAYGVLLRLYLKLISKSLSEKSRPLTKSETGFLIVPSATSLCIRIILQIMNVDEPMGYYSSVYDRYPVTNILMPLANFLLLASIVVSAVLFGQLMSYNEERLKRRLLEAQIAGMEKEITEIKAVYSDIRGLKHDMHNHISNISHYVNSVVGREDKTLSEYLGQMEKTVEKLDFSIDTGNPITDIIIHRRAQEAGKKGIIFKYDFVFPKKLDIDVFDIGVILDNALENCIAACEKAKGERNIYLSSYLKGSLMFIETENTFDRKIVINPETGLPFSSKENSDCVGLGLSNIKRCAEKYKGDIDIDVNGDRFNLIVMLHGNSEKNSRLKTDC